MGLMRRAGRNGGAGAFALGGESLLRRQRRGRAEVRLARLGGLASLMPRFAGFWLFATLTAIGAPLLGGFIGQFLIFSGSFAAHRIATVLVMASLVLTAAVLLWAAHRVFFGPVRETFSRVRDVTPLDLAYLVPPVVFVLLFGIRPGAVTPMINNGILTIITRLTQG